MRCFWRAALSALHTARCARFATQSCLCHQPWSPRSVAAERERRPREGEEPGEEQHLKAHLHEHGAVSTQVPTLTQRWHLTCVSGIGSTDVCQLSINTVT